MTVIKYILILCYYFRVLGMDLLQRDREILFTDLDLYMGFRRLDPDPHTSSDCPNNFKLIIPSSPRPVYCSRKVIDSSTLLVDMLEYVSDEDPGYGLSILFI